MVSGLPPKLHGLLALLRVEEEVMMDVCPYVARICHQDGDDSGLAGLMGTRCSSGFLHSTCKEMEVGTDVQVVLGDVEGVAAAQNVLVTCGC